MIKILVVVVCVYLLYLQWIERPVRLETIVEFLKQLPWFTIPVMITISLLSWLIESKKWQYLINDFYELRFRESVFQNLTAQAASFTTPLRIGEFALKPIFFSKYLRKKVVSRTLVGNVSQMIITTLIGIIAIIFYFHERLEITTTFLFIFTSVLLCLLVFVISLWVLKKWDHNEMKSQKWINTILYSMLRYLVFASNWLFILWLLDYPASTLTIIRNIGIFYLAVSVIPVFQLFDIAIRWTVAAYIFEGSLFNADVILFTTTLIWFTNSIVPTIIGCALLPFQKLKTQEE
ncbi:MAG: lysylphosphatidylglycerol synthase domain-containing protein [Nonlabens sp.]|uniref:lysylphosphatidylglycerol synthase domain-containing protein n=1 Tax=Nonlabens sp. TaxID=1888209 RepID=UPI0032196394